MTEIETDRLLLRRWRERDLDAYARICADPEVMRYMGSGAKTREQSVRSIEGYVRHWGEHGHGLWAAEYKPSGTFIGRIGLLYREDSPDGKTTTWSGMR